MPIKSFRGKLASGGLETISLHTNSGSTGYKIVKLEIIPENLSGNRQESCFKVFSIPQTTATGTIDFSDQTLIASGYIENYEEVVGGNNNLVTVFDNITFNQDIYLTHLDNGGNSQALNYHIELDTVKLDLNENTVATLKDIKNIEAQNV
tara:strand:- start:180 stop:629 length:450 start_codon:yes stop_codon:yes gene_type:complete